MSGSGVAAIAAAAVGVVAGHYLAALTLTVPDRDESRWWRGARPGRARTLACVALAATLGAFAGAATGRAADLPAFVVLALIATVLVVVDTEHHRLPDRLVGSAAILGVLLLGVAAAVRADWSALARAGEAALLVFAVFFVLALVSPRSLGFGDVKLAALLAGYLGWLGWAVVAQGLFLGFVLGAFTAVVLLITRRASLTSQVAFGPALIAGAFVAAVAHTAF